MIGSNQGRINKISEKLSGINSKFEQDRGARSEQVESRLRSLDGKFTGFQDLHNQRQTQLREQLIKLQRAIDEEQGLRDTQMASKIKEMISLEEKYSYLIEQEIKVGPADPRRAGTCTTKSPGTSKTRSPPSSRTCSSTSAAAPRPTPR
jgi:TolA-binding protein